MEGEAEPERENLAGGWINGHHVNGRHISICNQHVECVIIDIK